MDDIGKTKICHYFRVALIGFRPEISLLVVEMSLRGF
jgi:hypothetical protein